ncbi:uncharacterized protein LOC102367966 isoform X2 [Alligator sinensis]|uniref:Uncharacterized protein LOC102367966 isoform X2 n=1 Tax=Alligator sinensis TaxID=38654 RepID=A0A3Q0H8X8_ALLSI|nr:uncharacterized protein LOC102367966 isoform X2 [Alligator sinensis]
MDQLPVRLAAALLRAGQRHPVLLRLAGRRGQRQQGQHQDGRLRDQSAPHGRHAHGADHPRRAVLLPEGGGRRRAAEVAGGPGQLQGLPGRQQEPEGERLERSTPEVGASPPLHAPREVGGGQAHCVHHHLPDPPLSTESLGRKLSELRLYCDALTQQVLDMQESTRPRDDGAPLDVERMNEASSLLRATCSQFLSTLEECMKFANARLAPELYPPSPAPLPSDFVGTKLPHSHRVRRSLSHTGVTSPDRALEPARARATPARGTMTVLRSLEEMVPLHAQSGTPLGPSAKEWGAPLPAQETAADGEAKRP